MKKSTKQMNDTSASRIYDGKKAFVALLLLVSFTLPLTAAPLEIHEKTDPHATAKTTARPKPTPPVEKRQDFKTVVFVRRAAFDRDEPQ